MSNVHVLRGALALIPLINLLVLPTESKCQENVQLTAALTAWRTSRSNTSTIDYIAEGMGCYVKGAFKDEAAVLGAAGAGDVPARDHEFGVRFRFAARLNEGKMRKERREDLFTVVEGKPIFYPQSRWDLFDGTNGVRFAPDRKQNAPLPYAAQLVRSSTESLDTFIESKDYPFLLAHGIVPYLPGNLRLSDLSGTVDKLAYRVVRGPNVETNNLLVLRTASLTTAGNDFFELWADPSRGFAITKFVKYKDGSVRESIALDYQRTDGRVTLSSWEHSFLRGQKIAKWYKLRVTHVRINSNITDSEFVVAEQPGMMVSDERTGRYYLAGEGPNRSTPLQVLVQRDSRSSRRWLLQAAIWFGVGAAIALTTYALLARVRRR